MGLGGASSQEGVSGGMWCGGVVQCDVVWYGVVQCGGGYVGLQEAFHHLAASQPPRHQGLHPSYF